LVAVIRGGIAFGYSDVVCTGFAAEAWVNAFSTFVILSSSALLVGSLDALFIRKNVVQWI